MVLYGITGALFSYCVSLVVTSPLAAFAAIAGYQVIIFVVRDTQYRSCDCSELHLVVPVWLPFGAHLRQVERCPEIDGYHSFYCLPCSPCLQRRMSTLPILLHV